jgi:hypothetical protein
MDILLLGVVLILVSSSIYGPPFWRAGHVYFHLRKRKERFCPETERMVSVQMNARHAAWTTLTSGAADLQVSDCTRWPTRRGCGQNCLEAFPAANPLKAPEGDSAYIHRRGV